MTNQHSKIAEIRESVKETCFDCIDYDGETVTWQSVLDKYLDQILTEALHSAEYRGREIERESVKKKIKSMRMYAQDDGANGKGYASGFWRVLDEIESSLKPTSEEGI